MDLTKAFKKLQKKDIDDIDRLKKLDKWIKSGRIKDCILCEHGENDGYWCKIGSCGNDIKKLGKFELKSNYKNTIAIPSKG